jgi:hypothetical protein
MKCFRLSIWNGCTIAFVIVVHVRSCKHRSNSRDDGDSSDDDNAQSFADAIQQLAWTKDIDLTKGKALVSDADVIEKTSPRSGQVNIFRPRQLLNCISK